MCNQKNYAGTKNKGTFYEFLQIRTSYEIRY